MIGVLSKFYLTLHHPFLASWQCSFLCLVFCRNVFLSMHSPLLSLHAVSLPLCLIHLILCLIWLYYHSLISRAAVLYQDLKWLLQQIYPSCDNLFFWCVPFGYLYFYYFSYFSTMNQNWAQESILAWLWPHFHLVYWLRWDSNPQPFDCELSLLSARPDWRPHVTIYLRTMFRISSLY